MGYAGPGHDQVVQREEEGTKKFTAVVTDGAKVKQPGRFWFPKSQAHCPPTNTTKSLRKWARHTCLWEVTN